MIEDCGHEIYSSKGLNRLSRLNSEIAERVVLIEKSAQLCGISAVDLADEEKEHVHSAVRIVRSHLRQHRM
ncbi:MAG: hypothetical protein SCH70_10155 [Candidatus Methanoperedens sp.]|nr:hypothetical protein [Candidatus Methanoperedens sp.]